MLNKEEKMLRLICGNIGDSFALANICEAQDMKVNELTGDERKYLIHTNGFYYSSQEFCELHDADMEYFQSLLNDGIIVKTTGGYVWKNCV